MSWRDSVEASDKATAAFMSGLKPYLERAKKRLHDRPCAVRGCTGVNGTGVCPPNCDCFKEVEHD